MKPFHLDRHMVTMRGVFYPTGHVVLMLPGQREAEAAAKALAEGGVRTDEVSLIPAETFLGEIARTIGSGDTPLPSPGSEADTVRRLVDHAAQGCWGLLVHAPRQADCDRVLQAIHGHPVVFAERYRQLVIEDLET